MGVGVRRSSRATWVSSQEQEARRDGSPAVCGCSAPSAQGVSQLNEPKEGVIFTEADKAKLSLLRSVNSCSWKLSLEQSFTRAARSTTLILLPPSPPGFWIKDCWTTYARANNIIFGNDWIIFITFFQKKKKISPRQTPGMENFGLRG